MNHQQIESALEDLRKQMMSAVQQIADEYRDSKLIPFCRKHRLTYAFSMGTAIFYDRRGESVDDTDLKYLVTITKTLNLEVMDENDVFGYYIDEITEEDW